MAVPKYYEFFSSVLYALEDGKTKHVKEIREYADALKVSEEDRRELLPSKTQRVSDNRVNWAITYLRKAELIERVARGKYKMTPRGLQALQDRKEHVDLSYLNQFESFREFQGADYPAAGTSGTENAQEGTPQDNLNASFEQINKELSANLLSEIMDRSPAFFERMVVHLLLKMGYGSALEDGIVTGYSGDEGIDGIIREDKLGFSSIYIQAKRWTEEKPIGRPEIQKFVGALAGQGAQKGLFITTGTFTKEARSYVEKQLSTKVVLVDGEKLTKLMIEYNLGVSVETVYTIKKIDTDFFQRRKRLKDKTMRAGTQGQCCYPKQNFDRKTLLFSAFPNAPKSPKTLCKSMKKWYNTLVPIIRKFRLLGALLPGIVSRKNYRFAKKRKCVFWPI